MQKLGYRQFFESNYSSEFTTGVKYCKKTCTISLMISVQQFMKTKQLFWLETFCTVMQVNSYNENLLTNRSVLLTKDYSKISSNILQISWRNSINYLKRRLRRKRCMKNTTIDNRSYENRIHSQISQWVPFAKGDNSWQPSLDSSPMHEASCKIHNAASRGQSSSKHGEQCYSRSVTRSVVPVSPAALLSQCYYPTRKRSAFANVITPWPRRTVEKQSGRHEKQRNRFVAVRSLLHDFPASRILFFLVQFFTF